MAKALQVSASTISRDVAALLAQGFLVIPWVSANLDQTGAISPSFGGIMENGAAWKRYGRKSGGRAR